MDTAEPTEKSSALYAELIAKSSRVAELEARVSSLEAESACLRKTLATREATGRTGQEDPMFRQLEADLGGSNHAAVEKLSGSTACGVIEVSDDEEGTAVDANKARILEEGVVAAPTPRKRVVTRESGHEANAEDAEGGGGSNNGNSADLEDDDVSVTPRGKKRATARVVTSDSEDDDLNDGELGSGHQRGAMPARKRGLCGFSDSENEDATEGVHVPTSKDASRIFETQIESKEEEDMVPIGQMFKKRKHDDELRKEEEDVSVKPLGKKWAAAWVVTSDSEDDAVNDSEFGSGKDDSDGQEGVTCTRRRGLCGISDSENEDATEEEEDTVLNCQVFKKRKNHDELGEPKCFSTPTTRRSARLVKNQSEEGRAACQLLNFVEPKEYEGSEDDMEEDDDMDEFINDEESSENASDSAEESCDEPEVSATSVLDEESSLGPEESDGEVDYVDVMNLIGRKKKAKDWKFEGDMLATFDKHPELCLKAVCALYRRQTEEQLEKATLFHNKLGFSHIDAPWGSRIAEFLLDGDFDGPLKKTIRDLEEYDCYALEFCCKVASRYSKQLFAIYQNKEDPYFHP